MKKYTSLPKVSSCYDGSIIATQDGGFLISATIQNDTFPSGNALDLFVSKHSSNGDVEWSKTLDYLDYDKDLNAFQHANGNFILYPTSRTSYNEYEYANIRVTLSQDGTVLVEESHSDFTGILYFNGIDVTPMGHVIFYSYEEDGPEKHLQIRDRELNPIASTIYTDKSINSLYQPKDSANGYFQIRDGRLVKYNNQLEEDWNYEPAFQLEFYIPVSFSNSRYAILETSLPNPENNNPRTVLSIIEEGGSISSQGTLKEAERFIRVLLTDSNDNLVILSRTGGLLVESYSTEN